MLSAQLMNSVFCYELPCFSTPSAERVILFFAISHTKHTPLLRLPKPRLNVEQNMHVLQYVLHEHKRPTLSVCKSFDNLHFHLMDSSSWRYFLTLSFSAIMALSAFEGQYVCVAPNQRLPFDVQNSLAHDHVSRFATYLVRNTCVASRQTKASMMSCIRSPLQMITITSDTVECRATDAYLFACT